MDVVIQELQRAVGQLRRDRRFSVLAVTLLAAGIGSSVAVFSLLHSLVLQPLPFDQPERLIGLQAVNSAKGVVQSSVSVADHRDFARESRTVVATGAFRPNFASYTRPGEPPVRLVTGLVTPRLIETLGVRPFLGRAFEPSEFKFPVRSVILSRRAWQRYFGGDPAALGQVMILDDEPCTVVGIMGAGFREPDFVDAWLPFPDESPEYFARDSRFWTMVARLAPGVTLEQARAEFATLAADLAVQFPGTNRDWTVAVLPLQELRTGQLRSALILLLLAVGLVLFVACLNLANLLLARDLARLPALAVHLALGATPRRLALRLLVETSCLALLGAAIGSAAAFVLVPWAANRLPTGLIPRAHEAAVHPVALLVAVALAILCALLTALLPAWRLLRTDTDALLKQASVRSGGRGVTRWQGLLISAQIALTCTILAGALLLMKSLQHLQEEPLGFEPEHVLTLQLAPPAHRWQTPEDLARYYQSLIDAVRAVPGVAGAAVNASTPLSGVNLIYPTWPAGHPRDASSAHDAVYAPVSDGYFETVGTPLRAGRTFTAHDRAGGAPVAIVNETYARRVFDGAALGERVLLLPWMGETYREIVGVVADTRQEGLSEPPAPQVYVPQSQMPWFFSTLLIRLERPGVTSAVEAALRQVDPTLPFAPDAWTDGVRAASAQPRIYARLFGAFASIAILLSAFGLTAGLRYQLSQRRREIGIRMALGATPQQVGRWVLRFTGRWVLTGIVVGLLAAIPLALGLRSQLFGVRPIDPTTFLLLPALVATVAFLAALPSAWKAASLPPQHALESDEQ